MGNFRRSGKTAVRSPLCLFVGAVAWVWVLAARLHAFLLGLHAHLLARIRTLARPPLSAAPPDQDSSLSLVMDDDDVVSEVLKQLCVDYELAAGHLATVARVNSRWH